MADDGVTVDDVRAIFAEPFKGTPFTFGQRGRAWDVSFVEVVRCANIDDVQGYAFVFIIFHLHRAEGVRHLFLEILLRTFWINERQFPFHMKILSRICFAPSVRMAQVVSVDHLSITVSDFKKSKKFYGQLLRFLGFKVLDEYEEAIGWTNGITRLWISTSDSKKPKKYHYGDVGFHHYAFRLGSQKEVDDLQKFLKKMKAKIVDPAGEYYDDYYGVYFEDPDGLELEAMWYGNLKRRAA